MYSCSKNEDGNPSVYLVYRHASFERKVVKVKRGEETSPVYHWGLWYWHWHCDDMEPLAIDSNGQTLLDNVKIMSYAVLLPLDSTVASEWNERENFVNDGDWYCLVDHMWKAMDSTGSLVHPHHYLQKETELYQLQTHL